MESPEGIPFSYEEHAKLMFDLQVLAYRTDLTRVNTFMVGRELSGATYPQIGVNDSHHPITHHAGDEKLIAKVAKINHYHVVAVHGVSREASGDGGRRRYAARSGHDPLRQRVERRQPTCAHDLPILVVGGGAGEIKGGRHIRYPEGTHLTNLQLTLLRKMGVAAELFGNSDGTLEGLALEHRRLKAEGRHPVPATHSPRVEQVTGQCERGARLRSCARVLMRVLGHRWSWRSFSRWCGAAGGAAPLQPGVIAESARKVLDAAKHLDAETLHSLITQGADVSVAEGDGTTALHWAVHGDDLATVDVLLRAGAHADATNDYSVTPLSLACTNGSAGIVQRLLEVGGDPNIAQSMGETPLMACSLAGNSDAVTALVAHGANVNAKEKLCKGRRRSCGRSPGTTLTWSARSLMPERTSTSARMSVLGS